MDYDYLTRRLNEERERASKADNQAARDAHLELAEYYAAQLERLQDKGPDIQAATA